jgi:hypothetical protein
MQRGTGTLRSLGLVGFIGLGALAAGCTASGGDESILVLKNVAPPMSATGGVCLYGVTGTEAGIAQGVLDVAAGTPYRFIAQLKSRITANTGQEDQRTILTRGANVDLKFDDASLLSAADLADLQAQNRLHFMAPFSVALAPNGGLGDAPIDLVPVEVAAAVAKAAAAKPDFTSTAIQATFTVVGDLAGGNVTSQLFPYTVALVNGGLLNDKGLCSTLPSSFAPHTGNPCYPGQDFSEDCCTSPTGASVCPAVGTGM